MSTNTGTRRSRSSERLRLFANTDSTCATLGYCTECDAPGRICNVTTIIERRPSKTPFDIILMAEHAGF